MHIIYERWNHGITLYKSPKLPELADEMQDFADECEPEPEEELSF